MYSTWHVCIHVVFEMCLHSCVTGVTGRVAGVTGRVTGVPGWVTGVTAFVTAVNDRAPHPVGVHDNGCDLVVPQLLKHPLLVLNILAVVFDCVQIYLYVCVGGCTVVPQLLRQPLLVFNILTAMCV